MAKFVPAGPTRFKHQMRGLKDAIRNNGTHALLFDPGVGKTATTLDFASVLALTSKAEETRVLVVAPLAAIDTWVIQAPVFVAEGIEVWSEALGGSILERAETIKARAKGDYSLNLRKAVRHSVREAEHGSKRLTILSMTLDTFASRRQISKSRTVSDRVVDAIKKFKPDLIVVDESHRIKSPSTNTARGLFRIGKYAPRRMILTGTVMPHSPMDVYSQWKFLDPMAFASEDDDGELVPMDFGRFKEHFAKTGGWMGREIVAYKNLDEMQAIMAQRSTVARKEDSLDLPKVTDVTVPVDLTQAEKRAYVNMKKNLAADLSGGAISAPNRLIQTLRLRQITSGFSTDKQKAIQPIGNSKVRTVTSVVNETLAQEDRVIVFAFFKHEVAEIAKALKTKGTEILVITGDTPDKVRQEYRSRFGSKEKTRLVIVAQIKTVSLSINEFVTASHGVFASLSTQRDDFVQARDRLNRLGQTRPVTFWNVMALGTVDEIIYNTHKRRGNLEAAMLKHIYETDPTDTETA